jgi:hypothetical protein
MKTLASSRRLSTRAKLSCCVRSKHFVNSPSVSIGSETIVVDRPHRLNKVRSNTLLYLPLLVNGLGNVRRNRRLLKDLQDTYH